MWKKANPSLGITVGIDKVKAACESAKQNPAEENSFRQLRLNQWVKQAVRWMPMEKWDRCAFAASEDDLEGRVCYGGLDLSSTTDITAFVLVFPPLDEEDKYTVLPYFWIPEDNIDLRVRRDHVPYDVWERQGYLQTTEGNVVHYGYIEKFIERLGERFNIREIAFDRWGAVQMVQNLEGMGFTVVPFGQGFKDMSPAHQGADEAGVRGTHRPWGPSSPPLDDGQHLHPHRPRRGTSSRTRKDLQKKSMAPLPPLWLLIGPSDAATTPASRSMTAEGCCLFKRPLSVRTSVESWTYRSCSRSSPRV